MRPAPRRALGAALAVAAALTFGAPAAHAQDLRMVDDAADVWVTTGASPDPVPADTVAEADVRRVLVRHAARTVTVRAKVADLTRSGAGVALVTEIRTDEGVRRSVGLFTDSYMEPHQSTRMWKGADQAVRCALQHKVDYRRNTLTVQIPRACLSSPRWLQVKVQNAWVSDGYQEVYVDNPHDQEASATTWSGRVRRG
jgi:hypothetical protein